MLSTLLAGFTDFAGADCEVRELVLDSRKVCDGSLFVALSGTQVNGHDYILAAVEAGAAAVIYDGLGAGVADKILPVTLPCLAINGLAAKLGEIAARFYSDPTNKFSVIGITGTNGKTSCSHFLAQALHVESSVCAVIGTLGNGVWGELEGSTHTTPDAIGIQALMASFVAKNVAYVAMEVSSHGLDQGRVNGVRFETAVFTNLTHDHLDYHGDMQSYGQAKARLFSFAGLKHAVINRDDKFANTLLAIPGESVEKVTYGLTASGSEAGAYPHLQGQLIASDRTGLRLAISGHWGEGELHSPLLGRFNASNLLAVLAVLLAHGMAFDDALVRLSQVTTVAGRMERFGEPGQPLVVVDYAHTPDALQQALVSLRDHCKGQLWLVFGCGGDRDEAKRPAMGRIAVNFADHIIVTDDNPRHESPDSIVKDILVGTGNGPVSLVRNRALAIAMAVKQAAANDVVLVAGKGHEDYQLVGDKKIFFSDREHVQRLLEGVA